MNKLFALILVAGAITFTSCDKKPAENKADTAPVKEAEVKAPIVEEKGTEMKADTTKKKVVVVEEEKKRKK